MKVKHTPLDQYDLVYDDYIDKVTPRYAPRIGRFVIRFAELEHTLDISIADFLFDRSHELGYMVIEGNTLNNKIELFRKLFHGHTKYLHPSQLDKFQQLVRRLHEARVFRNYVAHANWRTLERSGYVRTRVSEKEGEVIFKKVRITPAVIDAWIRRVERLDGLLDEFVERASQAPPLFEMKKGRAERVPVDLPGRTGTVPT